jgi:lactate racemase
MKTIQLRTAAWYGDLPLELPLPDDWEVAVLGPHTPPPLTDEALAESIAHPIGQQPIRIAARGKLRPVILVDDLNRPTPAHRIVPLLLREFAAAGIRAEAVSIVMAPGTHGAPPPDALLKKAGAEAARCRLIVHDHQKDAVRIGTTSFGTPVFLNREVCRADFVIGVGGIYPNGTAGFGGGSKIVLGVLGTRSIFKLHYKHYSSGWGAQKIDTDFRRDIDEMARMARLQTVVSLHLNSGREIVGITCGDPFQYFHAAAAEARAMYQAPLPGDADVVIANTYPGDLSLRFVHMKGFAALRHCAPGASRIAIGSCPEGAGHHHLFPDITPPRFHRYREMLKLMSALTPRQFTSRLLARTARLVHPPGNGSNTLKPDVPRNPVWLFRPHQSSPLPAVEGIRVVEEWQQVLEAIAQEQGGRANLRVVIYPCSSLQCFGPARHQFDATELLTSACDKELHHAE